MTDTGTADRRWMARALQLAARGRYTARPNPCVGCVLVRDGIVVGEGWHRRAGEPHAEVLALRDAGDRARGATAYVTLEPCSHHGRTPPCAPALAAAGVARVVAASVDANPQVAGRGLEALREAGLVVDSGLMADAAEELNAGFFMRMRDGRPRVTVKLAQSLDGRTALASGESRWITGAAARRDVHRLRARSCAVVTGIGTALADDPSLTVRLAAEELPGYDAVALAPLRVLLDPQLRLPASAKLLQPPGRLLVVTAVADTAAARRLEEAGAEVLRLPGEPSGIDLEALLAELARRDINELLVEAGATLAGSFVAAGLVDELRLYVAATLLGDSGRPLLVLPPLPGMAQRPDLHIDDVRHIGRDLRIIARPCVVPGEPRDS